MALIFGAVGAPSSASAADGTNLPLLQGKQGDGVVSELNGKWYTQAYRGNVFHAYATGLTVPAFAASLVSVFSLYNPAGSTKNLQLISADVGIILATTVVDAVNIYAQSGIGSNNAIPTGQTVGTVVNGVIGSGAVSQGKFLTAATHVGATTTFTPVKIIGTFGAVTSTADNPIHYDFDGTLIIPPACIITVAMSTAASTSSGLALGLSWCEVPL